MPTPAQKRFSAAMEPTISTRGGRTSAYRLTNAPTKVSVTPCVEAVLTICSRSRSVMKFCDCTCACAGIAASKARAKPNRAARMDRASIIWVWLSGMVEEIFIIKSNRGCRGQGRAEWFPAQPALQRHGHGPVPATPPQAVGGPDQASQGQPRRRPSGRGPIIG